VPTAEQARLAVLIDADNVAPSRNGALLAEVATYGVASVRRMYGDWTTENLRGWKVAANEHAIQPIQQFAYTTGKNATDSAMIIDAMDLLYTERFDGFCLVSSDSDFTRLASRLRESGVTVYGFGEEKTPKPFVTACDRFIYLEVISDEAGGEPKSTQSKAKKRYTVKELRGDAKLVSLLRKGVEAASDDEGWAHLGGVGSHVRNQAPDFDPRYYGFAKLGDLVSAIGLFTVDRTSTASGQSVIRIRNQDK
jgi:uncharacterized LabA/DUF88 family protein